MNDTVFFTVIYPGVEAYLDDFLLSLSLQSIKEFDLFIVNDGITNVERWVERYSELSIQIYPCNGSIAKIRETALNEIVALGYSYVVFGDSDDFFSCNRIEVVMNKLQHYDVVVNDLSPVDEHGTLVYRRYLSNRYSNDCQITSHDILSKNIFGLTNTAVRVDKMLLPLFPDNLVAVDRFIFSVLLLNGCSAGFTNEVESYYRQHGINIAGIGKVTDVQIMRTVIVKKYHYCALKDYADFYHEKCLLYNDLNDDLLNDSFKQKYIEAVQQNQYEFPFWWETTNEEFK